MRMPSFVRTVGFASGLLVFTLPTPATALRLTCRDGNPNTAVSPGSAGSPSATTTSPAMASAHSPSARSARSRAGAWDQSRVSARMASYLGEPRSSPSR